ncbi:hypothetical protein D9756_002743 [Leucocoprinus leucothites]|uniref:XPG I-region protein n=1 Tax=Leucocoprinus leucothites TaxID=201217 RepID=A0A8H5GBN6_9AGAR|nr:hypothetical protein D9756_002743 [Leucoagaricus leucothites]
MNRLVGGVKQMSARQDDETDVLHKQDVGLVWVLATPTASSSPPARTPTLSSCLSSTLKVRAHTITTETLYFLHERKHLQSLRLDVLSESRLGIDAAYYLQQLLESPSSKEPLLAATGGLPLALASRIEADLRVLEKLHIKPVFVFPGLQPNKKWRQSHHYEYTEACRDRRDAWTKYENGQEDAATKLFDGRHGLSQWDLWRMVLRIFRNRNVEFIIAPYVAWAQLIYLLRHPKAYIHSIYGPTETMLYPGVDKVITQIDFTAATPTFQYASKRSVTQELSVSEDQFLDIGILVGFDQSPPFPPSVHEQALKATVDMVKYYKSGHAAVSAFAEHPAVKTIQYNDHFARTRSMIKCSLVLTSDGAVQPLPLAINNPASGPSGGGGHNQHHPTAADIPNDLHDIFTHRLPDEVYYYLSRGLMGPQALIWLTTGQIIESPPLDNGETNEYKRFVKEVITDGQTGPRATALALISSVLHNFWGKKQVYGYFWFDQPSPHGQKAISHSLPQTTQLAERVTGWNVPYPIVEDELRRQNSSTIDFALCLGATSSDKFAQRTKVKTNAPLEKKDEIVANVIWRFLELRGFLLNTHMHSPLARAMYAALRQARLNDKFQDSLYLFLELVRAGVMHGHLWSNRAFSGGPSFGTGACVYARRVLTALSCHSLCFWPRLSRKLIQKIFLFYIVLCGLSGCALCATFNEPRCVGSRFSHRLLRIRRLGATLDGIDDEKSCMLLVMRVLSIVPLNFTAQPWSAPLSRELLVFNSFVRSLSRSLRTLLEVTTLNMMLRSDARRPRDDILDVSLSLPFQTEVNTGFGVLAKVYLDALTHINNRERVRDPNAEGVKEAKALALEICEETFPGVKTPKLEVERGFRFWDIALMAMRQLHSEGQVLRELIDQFEAAEAWLAPMRPLAVGAEGEEGGENVRVGSFFFLACYRYHGAISESEARECKNGVRGRGTWGDRDAGEDMGRKAD